MIEILAPLVVLPPLLATAWIGIGVVLGHNTGEAGEPATAHIAQGAAVLSLLAVLGLDLIALLFGAPGQVRLGTWLASGKVEAAIGFTLDPLALSLATLVATICLLTLRFSVNYLHREAGFQRFFMILSLFTGAMLLIVTAGNLLLTFVGWELAGLSSYLLIAYAYERDLAAVNATRAFVTNRIGDAGFLLAIFLCLTWIGSLEWPDIAANSAGLSSSNAGLILLALLLPALTKSAQVPFSGWIARALEGPTPSSAVFYGSLMVHAGVYLLIRVEPLFLQAPSLMPMVALLGLTTALYGWLSGLTQTDVKTSLMFATTTQVGLMVLECGLGWFDIAAWHLALHAVWRAYQFLHAPALLYLTTRPARPVPRWLRDRKQLYTAALQRVWLDPAADALLVRPTKQLAQDIQAFDDEVVNRLVGLPDQTSAVSSLADREDRELGTPNDGMSKASGLLGSLLESLADLLYWFEKRLVLRGGGEGLEMGIRHLGSYLLQIENLLSRPRYLLLFIMATLVVIL
jgi:NADH:ubiquinone oxidoreductase subunit 5 (subunit L)/multisubunit Na+/H+ antiporter MnhA subunit